MSQVKLIGPDGTEQEFPEAAKDALLASGYTLPPEPEANHANDVLVGPDGSEVDASNMPDGAVQALLAAGFTWQGAAAEPADDEEVVVDIGGQMIPMRYGVAKGLITAGTAKLVTGDTDTPPAHAPLPEPVFTPPADDAKVQIKLKALPTAIDMPFGDARGIVLSGQGELVDAELQQFVLTDDKAEDKEVAQEAATGAEATDPPQAAATAGNPLDKALTEGPNEAGEFTHPAIPGKTYKTKGAVTQALNRLATSGQSGAAGSSSPAPETPAAGTPPAEPLEGVEAKLEQAKKLMHSAPGLMDDFEKLLGIFDEVAGKRNVSEFTEPELDKLIQRLGKEASGI